MDNNTVYTVDIAMVGPRGVGKTSLLAAMYKELDKELRESGFIFSTAPGPTQKSISECSTKLKTMANSPGIKIDLSKGIDGSSTDREYAFHLNISKNPGVEVVLRFTDIPGGWFVVEGEYKKAQDIMNRSHVSFLAVDAVALMEEPAEDGVGKNHEDTNSPMDIEEMYKRLIIGLGGKHTIVITLIRAETYVKNDRVDELLDQTKKAYKSLINLMKNADISILVCYVETVGSMRFHRFEEEDGKTKAEFVKYKKDAVYEPSRCSIPLRIAASHGLDKALAEAIDNFKKEDTPWAAILSIVALDRARKKSKKNKQIVQEALNKLTSNMKKDDYMELA